MSDNDFSSSGFEAQLVEHKLVGARCTACGQVYLPPRPMCRNCFEDQMEWVELPGTGRLVAFTTVHIAPTAMIEAGYGRDNPYCAGIVKLDDGPAISAQIVGVDAADPVAIKIGTPLKVKFLDRKVGEKTKTYLAFSP